MNNDKYIEIFNLFASTEFGKKLENSIRYERYKPQHITKNQWQEVLGDDVNNLRHMLVILNIVDELQEKIKIGPEQMHLLKIAAVTHDWGEAIIGDVTYEKKTELLEDQEGQALKMIAEEIVNNKDTKTEILETLKEVIFNPTSQTGEIFNIIERIGYLNTAILAFEKSVECSDNDSNLSLSLQWLTNNTIIRQLDFMIQKSRKHEFLKDYLKTNKNKIDSIFRKLDSESFKLYETKDQVSEAQATFKMSRQVWHSFSSEN
jgi:5'-deoxynucleotidase YfbR-like HD superfamily hydrolase